MSFTSTSSPSITFPKEYTLLSNNNLSQVCSVFVGLVVSGILDVTKLEDAHRKLVELWPAVGGTLVKSTTPYSFTSGSIVNFKSRHLEKKIIDLPLASFTQTSSSHPTFHRIDVQNEQVFHFDTMESFPPPDTLFALRVTTLLDGTLLGFRFAHHLFDGQACYDVVKAYNDLVCGRPIPQLIPPPDITSLLSDQIHGTDSLPPSVHPNHPHLHPTANFTFGLWGMARYIAALVSKAVKVKLGLGEPDDERMIHIPEEFVKTLRGSIQDELDEAAKRGELDEGGELEVSKNDVVTAWFLKGAYATFSPSQTQSLDVYYSLNYRSFLSPLPSSSSPSPNHTPNQLYLHNSFYQIRTSFPSFSYFQNLPLWRIALESRLTIVRQKQPSVVKKAIQLWEGNVKTVIMPFPPERPLAIEYVPLVSHWTTFEYNLLDFSPALSMVKDEVTSPLSMMDDESAGKRSGTGKVLFTQPLPVLPFKLTVKPLAMVMKDGKGGYWLRVNLLKSWWGVFEECVRTGKFY